MPFTVVHGIGAAWRAMRRERPDAVFSKGGYVTVPVGIAAWLCRVPVVIHESDHSLGLANRILARMATRVCLSEPARSKLPRWLARKTVITGLPLRHDLGEGNPDRLRSQLGNKPGAEVLLIFCGSSGSARINDAVRSQLDNLRDRFAVVHVCGKGNLAPALDGTPGYWQFEYLHQEMTDALWLADLVIGRAGATTLAELEALGKRAVLIPLPASVSRGDQLVNAEAYACRHEGRCRVIQDDDVLADGSTLVEACLRLAGAHASFSRPDPAVIHQAASRIAGETLSAARPRRRRAR